MASRTRDPEWLADVRRPGPNGRTFHDAPHEAFATAVAGLMEDDTNTSQFTPGCQAYAGYYNGAFANMSAVRAYASSQKARSFSYTPNGAAGADALDIEPGDASPSAAPAFYRGGGRYFYGSASTVSAITGALAGAGYARSSYKIVSAHYIGEHICGPSSCGYPQADATQFTDTYLGRSLDCTAYDASFFGAPVPPPPPPSPVFPAVTGLHVSHVTADKGAASWHPVTYQGTSPRGYGWLLEDGAGMVRQGTAVTNAVELTGLTASTAYMLLVWADTTGSVHYGPTVTASFTTAA